MGIGGGNGESLAMSGAVRRGARGRKGKKEKMKKGENEKRRKGEKGKRLGEREKNGADRNLTPAMLFWRHYSGSAVLTPTVPLNFVAACLRGEKKGFGGVVLPNGLFGAEILALKSVSKGKKTLFAPAII